MATRPFKAIIVGGGIAGLTLAIMFQKFDIDYVVLESSDEIAAAVGAGIGLMPNGLLVLDQLGCYGAVHKVAHTGCVEDSYFRASNGESIVHTKEVRQKLEKRHGYPAFFLDRQWLLQILFDQILDKSKIHLNARLDAIEIQDSRVICHMRDGRVFFGDLVIGADGVHSTVRKEMHRLSDISDPGYITQDEAGRARSYYQCSFGIAKDERRPSGKQEITVGKGKTMFLVSGPEHRCYWFFSVKLCKPEHGGDIQRYSQEDEARFVQEHQGFRISQDLTFSQLFSRRITSTLTPVHEVVYQRWYYKRIALVGDAIHKPNPIGGQGGNVAMETCAALLNSLNNIKDDRGGSLDGLQTQEIESALYEMQVNQMERAKSVVAESHQMQDIFARENRLLSTLIWEGVAPRVSGDLFLDVMSKKYVGATHLDHLPVPSRPRLMPFNFERDGKSLIGLASSMPSYLTSFIPKAWYMWMMRSKSGQNPARMSQR